jgi:hypothetical protein
VRLFGEPAPIKPVHESQNARRRSRVA